MKIIKQKDPRYPIWIEFSDGRNLQVVRQSKLKKGTFLRNSGCSIISEYEAMQWLGWYGSYPTTLLKWHKKNTPKYMRGKLTIRGVAEGLNRITGNLCTAKYYKPSEITLDKVRKILKAGSIILFEHKAPHTFMLAWDDGKPWLIDKGKCRVANLPVLVARKNKTATYGGMVVVTPKHKKKELESEEDSKMAYKYIKAKPISYGSKRKYEDIKFIVIHYTGNNGDTAKNNCDYFKNGNTREAGAHFFVDQNGTVIKSIAMELTAWSVGGYFNKANGAGEYYKVCKNSNSVSIELCDCASKKPSSKMVEATKELVAYIQKTCPNAKTIIRHWDVNGKACPARMTGKNNKEWNDFLTAIKPVKKDASETKVVKKTTKKSDTVIAKEVINGKWGNGETRKKKLKAAGYDYSKIQKLVNEMLRK